jgi:hypothetical protein
VGFAASPADSDAGTARDGGFVREDAGTTGTTDAGRPLDAADSSGDAGGNDAGGTGADAGDDAGAIEDAGVAPTDAGAGCPPGSIYSFTDHAYCIEEFQSPPLPYLDADADCGGRGWHLCGGSEYDAACLLGLPYDVDSWEWIKTMVSPTEAEKRIPSACGDTAIHPIVDPYPYRCCVSL